MIRPSSATISELQTRLAPFGQQAILAHWNRLGEQERQTLVAQIEGIDFSLLNRLFHQVEPEEDYAALMGRAECPTAIRLGESSRRFSPQEAHARGETALRAGQVAAVLVAGGQGTRLGFPHPKGLLRVGPLSHRTLFQIHADRIRARQRHYGIEMPWLIMTSPATHEETVAYFEREGHLGLNPRQIHLFCQGTMPALDAQTGRVLLEEPGSIFRNPDGHGGLLAAIHKSGLLRRLVDGGIETLFYFQVDNPLVDIAEPCFLGYHLLAQSEMTTQVVAKRDPLERVGNVVSIDGALRIVEYSDLPDSVARQRGPDGELRYWAGSIAVHAIETRFLLRLEKSGSELPFHRAHKIVPYVNEAGVEVTPSAPNAIKFERFIFDVLPLARNGLVVEVAPNEAFAPIKNASSSTVDTLETAQAAMMAQHRRWIEALGGTLAPGVRLEIHPCFADNATRLAERLPSRPRLTHDCYFADDLTASRPSAAAPAAVGTLQALIMAGGSGTRFWPASRDAMPKQLLALADQETMIQATMERLQGLIPPEHILVMTSARLAAEVRRQLPQLPIAGVLGEPCKRDTAPCIGLAACLMARQDPHAVMAVMPSDHVISTRDQFQEALRIAQEYIALDPTRFVTFGIRPSYPAESFGYIERGDRISPIEQRTPVYQVARFHEKPKAEVAREYVASGNFYWNSGIFVWRVQAILAALREHAPAMLARLERIADAWGRPEFEAVFATEFAAIEGRSIDYVVLEKARNIAVIEAPFAWDDVGSWQAMARLLPHDDLGNTLVGKHLAIDTRNCIVRSDENHLVVTIGLNDCVIVHTPSATLVVPRDQEERVREAVQRLRELGEEGYL